MRSTSSPMVLIWARLRQLRGRSERSSSSMRRSRSGEPPVVRAGLAELEALGRLLEVGHQADQGAQGVAGRGQGLARGDGAVGLDVEDQAVEVGRLLDPDRLDVEGHPAHRREDRVDRDDPDGRRALVAVGRDVAPAPLDRDVEGQAALGVQGGDVQVGVEHLDVGAWSAGRPPWRRRGRACRSAGSTGSSPCTRTSRSFRFKMMSVTSSFTPGRVVNSCRASSKRTWVTAAPGDGREQGAAEGVAERVAEAGVERADGEPLAVVLLLVDGLDGRALDDEHGGAGSSVGSCGRGGGAVGRLLRVELDDELLLHRLVDVLAQRRVRAPVTAKPPSPVSSQAGSWRSRVSMLRRTANISRDAGLQGHHVALADPVARDGHPLAVHQHVAVADELAGLGPAGAPAGPEDHVVEAQLEHPQQVLAGDARAGGWPPRRGCGTASRAAP